MRRLLPIWLLFASLSSLAQTTAVTAVVRDSNGSLYTNGTISINFVGENTTPGAGPYLVSGSVFPTSINAGIDAGGNMAISLFDNVNAISPTPSQWQFNVCSAKGYVGGNAAGQFCFTTLITITGATQNITTALTAAAPILPILAGGCVNAVCASLTGNNAFTGTNTFSNSATFSGTVSTKNLEGVQYCDQFAGDIGQACNLAIAALPATGGTVYIPAGTYNFSHTINLTNGVILKGSGPGSGGFIGQFGTNLVWTGTGGTAIALGGGVAANQAPQVRDLSIDNTGTGAIGIDVEASNSAMIEHVWIYPQTGFSTAGIQIGKTATTVATTISNSYVRGNVMNLFVGIAQALVDSINTRWLGATSTPNIQIGDASHAADTVYFIGGTIEPDAKPGGGVNNDIDGVLILNCLSCKFTDVYFEIAQSTATPNASTGTGYAINIPSTATAVHGVTLDGVWVSAFGNALTSFAINSNLSSADVTVSNSYFTGFNTAGAVVFRAQAGERIAITGSQLQSTGMTIASGAVCVDSFGNSNGAGLLGYQSCSNLTLAAAVALQLGSTAVGSLPSAAANAGVILYVTDSTSVASEGQTCVGSSTHKAMALSDGTQWKCF